MDGLTGGGDGGEGGKIGTWIKKHGSLFHAATRHPFIVRINHGSVDLLSFKCWLEQDYMFVRHFVSFLAHVLLKACKESNESSDMEVILGGLASLHLELAWFKSEAKKWNVQLSDISVQKENENYLRFIDSLMKPEVSFAVLMTAFWAIEAVYQVSFSFCLEEGSKTPLELMEACGRWGNDEFKHYCQSLQEIANRLLQNAAENVLVDAEAAFVSVLEKEIGFWSISTGKRSP